MLLLRPVGIVRTDQRNRLAYGLVVGLAAGLGVRLPAAAVLSHDVDIAQFGDISLAVEDAVTPPMLDILRTADPTFAAIPHIHDQRQATVYQARSGVRVDFLTPNQGPDTDEPQHLEALRTDAEPMRFLDFLIAEPTRAMILHGEGDRKSTRLNSSHIQKSRMPSSA